MGMFDKKKKKDDFDSPVEEISLGAPATAQAAASPSPAGAPAAAGEPEPAPVAVQPKAPPPRRSSYGIDRAIELMRMLPADNIELVVRVVKTTLESTQIRVVDIIEDATHKQQDIEARVAVLKSEIADLESQIATRKAEIATLEADHAETTTVKERLILGEKLVGAADAAAKGGEAADSSQTSPSKGKPKG